MDLPRLAAPLRVGPLTLANRLVLPAHLTDLAEDGRVGARLVAHYAARAAGGVGLIVTEEHTVDATDRPYERLIRGEDPAVLPGYRALTDAVHAHGVPVLAQLNHNGGQAGSRYARTAVRAPSAVPDPLFREVPRALAAAELPALFEAYATVAARCVEGGFDGVEVQASQSSLIRQFLSRATNRRTDGHGGPLGARARFLLETLAAVREAVGRERVLGLRLALEEPVDGGTTLAEAIAVARLVDASGLVDYLSTTVGVATASMAAISPPMSAPAGAALPLAAALRAAVGLPVVGVGRIVTPEQAERALAAGACDLVGVVRGQLADPAFAAKALAGRPEEVHRCTGCNQECVGRVGRNRPLRCVANPAVGREGGPAVDALPTPRRRPRRVLVVGGGPAGLTAAAAAAARGHAVRLVERADTFGGQLRVAASAPARLDLLALVDTATAECRRRGVDLRTGIAADRGLVLAERPDSVVVATGARARRPAWAGAASRVVDVRDVLDGRVRPAGEVLVVDELGGAAAPSVAELLATAGCAVELLTGGLVVAEDLLATLEMQRWRRVAAALGIRRTPEHVVLGVDGDRPAVRLLHHPTGAEGVRVVDWVVVATPADPADELGAALRDEGLDVHRIGDCRVPRDAAAATREGHRVAGRLGALPAAPEGVRPTDGPAPTLRR